MRFGAYNSRRGYDGESYSMRAVEGRRVFASSSRKRPTENFEYIAEGGCQSWVQQDCGAESY